MPRIPRLEKLFVKPNKTWSRFPKRPLPFRMVEWETKEHKGEVLKVTKLRPPCQIPAITPIKDWNIVRGDLVQIMVGSDTGKQGKVRAVARKKNQLKVIGMNLLEQYVEDMGDGKPGYMLNEEPLHYYDVQLVDPLTGKPTKTTMKYNEEGHKVRVCTNSGRVIPKPPFERTDWKTRSAVKEGEDDTKADVVQQFTYVPSLLLFHEEIMKEMNIAMSVPKRAPERRDLIFNEIENDVMEGREQDKLDAADSETQKNAGSGILKKLAFWK